MRTFLGFVALYAFVLGLYGIAQQAKALARWVLDRSRFR